MREKSCENADPGIVHNNSAFLDCMQQATETEVDIFCILTSDGHVLEFNAAEPAVLGYSPDYYHNRLFTDIAAPEDVRGTLAFLLAVSERGRVDHYRNRLVHQSGVYLSFSWSATFDAGQNVLYCAGKRAEDFCGRGGGGGKTERSDPHELRAAGMGRWEYIPATGDLFWSQELFDLYGINDRPDPWNLAALFFNMVHPDDLTEVTAKLKDITKMNSEFVHRLKRPDGELLYVCQNFGVQKNDNGNEVKLTGVTLDVTGFYHYKTQLEQSERRFRSLMQTGSDIIGIIDLVGNYIYVSDNTATLLGYEPQSLIGKNAFDYIHPDDVPAVYEQISFVALEQYVEVKPFRFRHAHGEWRWIETNVTNRMEDPAIQGLVVNSRDITDKKEYQDKLSKLSKITEETSNAVVITNAAGRITWVNNAFERITGYLFQEVSGKKPGELLQGPLSNSETITYMRRQMQKVEAFDVEIVNYPKQGPPYWIQIQCQPQLDDKGQLSGFFAIQTDITERKRLQEQLQEEVSQRQKRVTSAMVQAQEIERRELGNELHDNVNQILTTVKLYLEMAIDGTANNDFVAKARQLVQTSIDEIRQISKRLAAPELADLDVKRAINDLVESIAIASEIKFSFSEHGLTGTPISDDIKLALYRIAQEHFTNIIKHAGATKVQISLSVLANNLSLLVIDDGKGFDTKQKRTGIGLSNMRNRVETVNGKLEIKSKPGEGCTLLAILPLAACPKADE